MKHQHNFDATGCNSDDVNISEIKPDKESGLSAINEILPGRTDIANSESIESRRLSYYFSSKLEFLLQEEKKRLARELHDELGQALTVLKIDLSWLSNRLPSNEEPLREKTRSMSDLIDSTIEAVQRISLELRPALVDELGLFKAIRRVVQQFQERTGIVCNLKLDSNQPRLDPHQSAAIFRVTQESLTNVARHAGANKVRIYLKKTEGFLRLEIRDDGVGIVKSDISNRSLGIIGMRERLQLLGGELHVRGTRGKGTLIVAQIPFTSQIDYR